MSTPDELRAIAADDELLDALGQGAFVPQDDALAGALAAWRDDLNSGLDVEDQAPAAALAATVAVRRPRRLKQVVLGAAAGAILLAGLGVATYQADPGSPLWPVAKVVYPGQADVRAAEHAVALARAAADAGRTDEARRSLDDAAAYVARIDDPDEARRLGAEIETLRRQLAAAGPSAPASSAPTASTAPVAPGGPGGPAVSSSGAPQRSPSPAPPANPLPRQPAPEPAQSTQPGLLPLPSIVPSLPLPTGLLPSLPDLPILPPLVNIDRLQ